MDWQGLVRLFLDNSSGKGIALATLFICCFPLFGWSAQMPTTNPSATDLRQLYESGQQALRQDRLEEAEKLFDQVLAQSYARRGRLYCLAGRYSEAVADLEEAKKLEPQNHDVESQLGFAYLGKQQYAAAAKNLLPALLAAPGDPETLVALGEAEAAQGNLQEARTYLERAVKNDPLDHLSAYQLATVLLAMRDADGAQRIFSQLKGAVGDSARFHLLVGRAYESTGYHAKGDVELRRALELDPKVHYAHHLLGMSALQKGVDSHAEEAQREFQAEVGQHPEEFGPLFMLGVLMEMHRQWPQALTYLHRAQRLQPQDPELALLLGSVELSGKNPAQAITDLQRAIDLTQGVSGGDTARRAHYLLSRAYRERGDLERAGAEAQEAQRLSAADFSQHKEDLVRENPVQRALLKMSEVERQIIWQQLRPPVKEDASLLSLEKMYLQILANTHNSLGLIAARQNRFEEAVQDFELGVKLEPDSPQKNYNLGLAAFRAQRFPEAIAALKRAVAREPENQAAVTLLGLAEFQYEDFAEALPDLEKAEAAHPGDPGLLLALGTCLVREKRGAQAQEVFDRLLRSNAERPEVHILLGQAAYAQGRNDAAVTELRNALALDPHAPEAHYYLGMIELNRGQLPAADADFRAEAEDHPENAKARYNLAFVLLQEQKREDGIRLLEALVKDVPGYAEVHYSLGKAFLDAGDLERGTAELEAAVRLDPGKAFSHYQLGRAYQKARRTLDAQHEFERSRQLKDSEPKPKTM